MQKDISAVMFEDIEDIEDAVSNLSSQYVAVKLKCRFYDESKAPGPVK